MNAGNILMLILIFTEWGKMQKFFEKLFEFMTWEILKVKQVDVEKPQSRLCCSVEKYFESFLR